VRGSDLLGDDPFERHSASVLVHQRALPYLMVYVEDAITMTLQPRLRKSGAWLKAGARFAIDLIAADRLGGGPLSMPSAAARRWPKASIYRVCHPVTIDDRDRCLLTPMLIQHAAWDATGTNCAPDLCGFPPPPTPPAHQRSKRAP